MVTSRGAAKLSLLVEVKILFGKFDKGCGWEGRGLCEYQGFGSGGLRRVPITTGPS